MPKGKYVMRAPYSLSLGFLLLQLCAASTAHGAGFAVLSESPEYLAQSNAGITAANDTPSAQFYNPATISELSTSSVSAGAALILPSFKAKDFSGRTTLGGPINGNASSDDVVPPVTVPNIYGVGQITDKTTLGLAVTAPWGLSTTYDDNWVGRYHAVTSKLATVNINPSVSYTLTPKLDIAAGVQAQYIKGRLTNAVDCGFLDAAFLSGALGYIPGSTANDCFADLTGDDWGYGYNVGGVFKPDDDTRVGISYRSQIKHELQGSVKYNLPNPALAALGLVYGKANLKVTTPAVAAFGVQHDLNSEWTLAGDIHWTQWSSNHELRATFASGQSDGVTDTAWKDTMFYSLGVRYRPDSTPYTLRAGLAYDESPTDTKTREPRVPDSNRYWATLGGSVDLGSGMRLDTSYVAMWFDKAQIDLSSAGNNALSGRLQGNYDSFLHIIGVQLAIDF